MIRSMTGFGRATGTGAGYQITVEIKSVNHRYFEFSPKVSRTYSFLEEKLKSVCNAVVSRGKLECSLYLEATADDSVKVTVNEPLAHGYMAAIASLGKEFGLNDDLSALSLARFPDILNVSKAEVDEAALWEAVKPVVEAALEKFVLMREAEGERLRADVLSRADTILGHVSFVEERSPETVRIYHEKLLERMRDILADKQVEESRLLTEAAVYADKVAVAEETVRLRSHIDQLYTFMDAKEPVGRKLDFLVQEMNREANTIGSKAQDVEIARRVIDMKAEIEKIREQIQNIE